MSMDPDKDMLGLPAETELGGPKVEKPRLESATLASAGGLFRSKPDVASEKVR
jgi:hypothetical protein